MTISTATPTTRERATRARAMLGFLLLLAAPSAVRAQDVAVPVEIQVPLFIKILAFDRNLGSRPPGPLVVGVLYQGNFRASADIAAQVKRALRDTREDLKVISIDLDQTPDLIVALSRQTIHVLYVSPLRAFDLKTVTAISRQSGVRTVTGVPRYVEDGLGIGIDLKGERPEIVVNLLASRAEGADLDAQLLKLARIVR